MKRITKKNLALCLTGAALLAGTTITILAIHTAPVKDPFAGLTPRTPCASRSMYDLEKQEQYGTPAPQPQNPSYCHQPVCQGSHTGKLAVRYDNAKLLHTGTATLDIATDDGSPLGIISLGPIDNVEIKPLHSLYSPDLAARFVLTAKGEPVGPGDSYGDGPFDGSKRQLTYPLSIDIKAWCGAHIYNTSIVQKLEVQDTAIGR